MRNARANVKSRRSVVAIASLLLCSLLLQPAVGARESSKGYDGDLTLFSPEGRLYQVEYVMRAVGYYGCPAVGVHGDDCCVVACKRDLPDELVYPESVSSIFRINDDIYTAATGMRGDVLYQVKRAQLQAVEYKRQYGSPMPSRLLTLAMADAAQVKTQHAALRPMACVCFVISVDDPSGPALFRVEPSGQAFQAWGTAAGRGSAASLKFLEETLDRAKERQDHGNTPDRLASGHSEAAGDATSSTSGGNGGRGEGEGRAAEETGDGTRDASSDDSISSALSDVSASSAFSDDVASSALSDDSASGALSDDGASSALSDDSDSSEGGRAEGGGGAGGGVGAGSGRRESSDGGGARVGWTAGFGVVGEEGTVELALQALSKASSGKDTPPLSDKNVEIAIASRDFGIRVCSRKEVRGFLGKMKLSPTDCVSAVGR